MANCMQKLSADWGMWGGEASKRIRGEPNLTQAQWMQRSCLLRRLWPEVFR